jgi:hypothetical protein
MNPQSVKTIRRSYQVVNGTIIHRVSSAGRESYSVDEILERSFGIERKDGYKDRFSLFTER